MANALYWIFLCCISLASHPGFGADLIRNVKTIVLPFAPGAYNASIIAWEEGYLLAYRYDIYVTPVVNHQSQNFQYIGLVRLDKEFNPLDRGKICVELGNRSYDPRLVRVGDAIYLIYCSARPEDINSISSSQLCLTRVHSQGGYFTVDPPTVLSVAFQNHWEKNWVPFSYNDSLFLSYSIHPHRVILPKTSGACDFLFETEPSVIWDFGIIRGGTPAILVDGEYLAFFHSSVWNPAAGRYIYSMGAYTFSARPPFQLTRISSLPISHPDFYSTPTNELTNSHVIFPSGLIVNGSKIQVSYGENDGAIKVIEIEKNALFESLKLIKN
jgi:predicted GH43/DUF377 family glycosyl hydrolase